MHGGRINAASAGEGAGATFVVMLPIIPALVRPAESTPREAASDTLDALHILVVDDDPDSLEVLTSLLQMHGARVTAASGSAEALQLLQHDRPDLLISDIAMPDRDGYWLLEQVRRLPTERGGDVKAVALSAFASAAARERALAAGFGAHISKPLTAESLLDSVGQVLNRA